MKTHSEFLPQLAAYYDGALTAEQRESVASHVRDCPECQRLLGEWKALDEALKALPEPAAETDGIQAQVLNRIAPGAGVVESVQPTRPRRIPIPMWASAAAAAVILVAAGLWYRDNEPEPDNLRMADREMPTERAAPPAAKSSAEPEAASPVLQPSGKDELQATEAKRERETAPAPAEIESVPPRPEPQVKDAGSTMLAVQSNSAAASDKSTAGDSGILQQSEESERLAEFVVPSEVVSVVVHYRVPDMLDAAIVEVNLRPVFDVAFEGIGYAPTDMLAEAYDPSQAQPRRLSPQVAYMVSSMRMERSVLLSRTTNQVRTPATQLRLAEITWRLANLTADQDDVRNAIAAQTAVMRAVPSIATQSLARLAHLRSLRGQP